MHIAEGYLPAGQCLAWTAVSATVVAIGARGLGRQLREHPETKLLLGAAGAFAFLLSAVKLPSVTGSCSHATGMGLGTILFGPGPMGLIGSIVLLFQALLLAHGGLTTLGANVFSMAIMGPWVTWAIYSAGRRTRLSRPVLIGLAAALGDLATYLVTAGQLALAYPDPAGGMAGAFVKFAGVFCVTQIPLALSEGLLTVVVMNMLAQHSPEELRSLDLLAGGEAA